MHNFKQAQHPLNVLLVWIAVLGYSLDKADKLNLSLRL